MINFLKRLFIHLPLLIIWSTASITIIIPIIFWLVTGDIDEWIKITDDITDL